VLCYDQYRDAEVMVKKIRKPTIVYKIAPSGNSELAGRKNCKCGKCCQVQKCFHRDLYSLRVLSIELADAICCVW